jgi:hypothetical protein
MERGMPIYDYALLALLTSGAQAPGAVTLTLGPEVIGQPNGGVLQLATSQNSTKNSSHQPVGTSNGPAKAKSGAGKTTKPFIKIEGVDGEAKDKDHKSWSD